MARKEPRAAILIEFIQATGSGICNIAITAGPVRHERSNHDKTLRDMKPVDDFVTQNTPGLKIWEERLGRHAVRLPRLCPGY